ncbi:TRAP transporter small permease [Halocynthiibacter namhaensis]|uniref:TRAP transporter small permease n=1 Tax=Halocynthiibacter namhaensis TaxID=1290553 RepID=UPI000579595B|nr:TRAP transporter small permease subunit [Halocynthiibacter namhaensis]
MSSIRKALDSLYLGGGILASLCLIGILVLIVVQMVARWTGEVLLGAPDYAGYCMAGASFFAFAYALNHGSHIRVSLGLSALGRFRRKGEIWCFGFAGIFVGYYTYITFKFVYASWRFGFKSDGSDATLIWIPQMVMCLGSTLLFIAFVDNFLSLIFSGKHRIRSESLDSVE